MIRLSRASIIAAAPRRKAGYLDYVDTHAQKDGEDYLFTADTFERASKDFAPGFGPGTELKRLLKFLRFKDVKGCRCASRARLMDRRGCDWCERHLGTIVGWLAEEAERRELLFQPRIASNIVRLAIWRARRKNSG